METLPPRRWLSEPSRDTMYHTTKRQSIFVQVFPLRPVPDIFLNETKWGRIFGIWIFFSTHLRQILRHVPHPSRMYLQALPSYLLRYCVYYVQSSGFLLWGSAVTHALKYVMVISRGAKQGSTSEPPNPLYFSNINPSLPYFEGQTRFSCLLLSSTYIFLGLKEAMIHRTVALLCTNI